MQFTKIVGISRPASITMLAIVFATASAPGVVAQGSVATDRAALQELYDATGGTSWTYSTNWKTSAPVGEWYGVTADSNGRVTDLSLSGNELNGPIPAKLGALGKLQSLNLAWNDLTGPIPPQLGALEDLRSLNLGGNELNGPIPAALGRLANLSYLSLDWNELSGPIPTELHGLANLSHLILSYNELSGPIPAALGRLANLSYLSLSYNELSGPIPAALGRLANLWHLSLAWNDSTGPIPAELGSLKNLEQLDLSYNWGLLGPLPSGLQESGLEELDIFATQACAPVLWRDWLETIDFIGPPCGAGTEVTIDVAVVYTPGAREAAGGTAAIEAAIDLMLAETNQAYAASAVTQRLALVARSEVRYTESGSGRIDRDRLADPSDGHMDEVHDLRDRIGADLVHLIVAESNVCGIASLVGAFGLTALDCGGLTFAHELGHNMGLYHDRFQVQLSGAGRWLIAHHPAYGYVNRRIFEPSARPSGRWRTIMSYADHCKLAEAECAELPRFSNATQRYDGDPLGVAHGSGGSGVDGPADAAAVLDATGPAVAAWRDGPPRSNRPPAAVGTLPDRRLAPGSRLEVDVSLAFVDPDGDPLTYTVSSSAPHVASVLAVGARVMVTAVGEGAATIGVTAADPGGLTVDQSFTVTVEALPASGTAAADRAALEALYDGTGGPSWAESTNWKTSAPLGEWYGVTADSTGRVTDLSLPGNALSGPIPTKLGELANLRNLNLPWNDLTGPIPAELRSLENVKYLDLRGNNLSGPLPAWLGSLSNLERYLGLGENDLSGPIPDALGSLENLRALDLGGNDLSGPIPDALGSLENLRALDLGGNWGLSGPLPSGLQESGLQVLDIFVTQACVPVPWRDWLHTIEFFAPLCETGTDVTIDVAVLYTPEARATAGGAVAIEAAIDLMVAETNQAYEASGVRQRVTLAARSEVPYTESGFGDLDLRRLAEPSDGHLDEVHALRDRVGADLVHLIVAESNVSGIASLVGAFGLTVLDGGGRVFAHELGHNMGLYHDRFEELVSGGGVSPHPAYGYVNQRMFEEGAPPSSRWVTTMSYVTHCNLADARCSWLLRFSNPRQRYNGDELGIRYGAGESRVAGPADAAGVLNAAGPAVALWRDRPPGANRPPTAVGILPDRRLDLRGTLDVNVSQAFSDPDGDPLTYTAASSAPQVVTVSAVGSRVTLTGVGEGAAAIRVTATDPGGLSAGQSFNVPVLRSNQAPFTDDPIVPGETPVRAVHFTELRARIDVLRSEAGLARFRWTDPELRAGVTRVRRVHLIELRTTLDEAYRAAGRAAPRWTDPAPVAGTTPIRAMHLTELRAAVLVLE